MAELHKRRPELVFVRLPSLYVGSDALPVAGSLSVPAVHLKECSRLTERAWPNRAFITCLSPITTAVRAISSLWRSRPGRCEGIPILPDRPLWSRLPLHGTARCEIHEQDRAGPRGCGDDPDSHAGTNETSLMLACSPQRVRGIIAGQSIASAYPTRRREIGGWVGYGCTTARRANTRARPRTLGQHIGMGERSEMVPYMGDPSKATHEAGEAMLAARVEVAMGLFERALAGGAEPESIREPVHIKPMLWRLRVLRRLPE